MRGGRPGRVGGTAPGAPDGDVASPLVDLLLHALALASAARRSEPV